MTTATEHSNVIRLNRPWFGRPCINGRPLPGWSFSITYGEQEWVIGERVVYNRMLGRGVRGDPFRHITVGGRLERFWRSEIMPQRNHLGLPFRILAIRIDDGALLIAHETACHPVTKKHPPVIGETWTLNATI